MRRSLYLVLMILAVGIGGVAQAAKEKAQAKPIAKGKQRAAQAGVASLFTSLAIKPSRIHASRVAPMKRGQTDSLSKRHFVLGRRVMGSEFVQLEMHGGGDRATYYLDLIVGSDGSLMTGRYKDFWDYGYKASFKPISLNEAQALFPKLSRNLKQRLLTAFSTKAKWGDDSRRDAPTEYVKDEPEFWRGR